MIQRVLICSGNMLLRPRGGILNIQGSITSTRNLPSLAPQFQGSITKTQISKLLTLRAVDNQNELSHDGKGRPLVLLFDWLFAKPAAVEKYCNIYHSRGLDVLTINGRLAHFLWPPKGYKLAEELLTHILQDKQTNFIIHAFSVGAYMYTLCLMLSKREPEKYGVFRERVKGQIFDSIVIGSYDHMSTGIALALPGTKVMKKPILELMDVYYSMTKKTTRDEYDKLVSLFKTDPVPVPTILFYSYGDPMCHVPSMEETIKTWHRELPDFDVTGKCWEKSVHAAHLKFHQEEYIEAWTTLMAKVHQEQ